MKKIFVILAVFVMLGATTIVAQPLTVTKERAKPVVSDTGSFVGEIGDYKSKEWVKVGEISGTYEQKGKFFRFDGSWEITKGDKTVTGTMKGGFGKNILIGKISITESGKSAPIVGFIKVNKADSTFTGRFMSVVGPALNFQGTFK